MTILRAQDTKPEVACRNWQFRHRTTACSMIAGRNCRFAEHVWNGSSGSSLAARIHSSEMGKDAFYLTAEPVEDGAHVLNPFDHPLPFELNAVGMMNDVPEAAVRLHL